MALNVKQQIKKQGFETSPRKKNTEGATHLHTEENEVQRNVCKPENLTNPNSIATKAMFLHLMCLSSIDFAIMFYLN